MMMIMIIIIINNKMANTSNTWSQKINNSGYRITGARQMIVEIIFGSSRALTPTDIFLEARERGKKMGLVTVYRTLEKLEELNLITRIHQSNGCHAYLRAYDGHEHILLCTRCGQIVYFSGDDLTNLIERVALQSGFSIQEHWLQFHGLCPDCQ